MFDKFLKNLGFVPNKADHCFYTFVINANEYVLLLLYVDVLLLYVDVVIIVLIIGKRFRISFSGELVI